MTSRYVTFAGGLLAGAVITYALGGFRAETGSSTAAHARPKPAEEDSRRVLLSAELAKRAKLETLTVSTQNLAPTLQLVGSVTFDANEVAEVGARIEGRVTRMLVTTGDVVSKGQALAEIESNLLGEVISDVLSTRANLVAAEHAEKRESSLYAQQLSSAPLVERARAEVKALNAQLRGAEQRLLAMGLSKQELTNVESGQGPRLITLRSPLDGQVTERYAVLGQVVDATEPVLQVANLDSLWVELALFEHDLGRVAVGNEAEIESETYAGKLFKGRVAYVDASVDLATRTAGVRIEVDNKERLLRPGQFVRARLSTTSSAQASLRVPRKAVLQVEGEPSVFLAKGNNEYLARSVELGASAGDFVEVTRGLVEGDRIVVAGAFALKSELLR